jgi:hypothetical protein
MIDHANANLTVNTYATINTTINDTINANAHSDSTVIQSMSIEAESPPTVTDVEPLSGIVAMNQRQMGISTIGSQTTTNRSNHTNASHNGKVHNSNKSVDNIGHMSRADHFRSNDNVFEEQTTDLATKCAHFRT